MSSVEMDPSKILDLPMDRNDSGANTVRGYLIALLQALWEDGEGFSGKRPFGNGGWECDLYAPLIKAGLVRGEDEDGGYPVLEDEREANNLISAAITALGKGR